MKLLATQFCLLSHDGHTWYSLLLGYSQNFGNAPTADVVLWWRWGWYIPL